MLSALCFGAVAYSNALAGEPLVDAVQLTASMHAEL